MSRLNEYINKTNFKSGDWVESTADAGFYSIRM